MNPTSLTEIAQMSGARLIGSGDVSISRVSKDSRTIQPGDLYVALKGENFDGNAFAAGAVERGAAALMLDKTPDEDLGVPVLLVDDGLAALQRLAAAWRSRLSLKVVGITGSSGKTSTKEFVAGVLGKQFRVVKTEGNLNNHIGVPLSILAATTEDTAAVWEMGMNHPGEIAPLAALAKPQVGIITNVGVAHIEYLGSQDAIALEKGMLAEAIPADGIVILNADDPRSPGIGARSKGRVVLAGLNGGELSATNIVESDAGCSFTVHAGDISYPASIPTNGSHMVANALLALAAGVALGIPLQTAIAGLAQSNLGSGRLQRRTIDGILFLDDTYNANPDSMEAALKTLRSLPGNGRRIALLGRMGELGNYAAEGYARTGRAAGQNADILITVGPEAEAIASAARETGLGRVHEVADTVSAARILRGLSRPGDIALVKGSRSARMETVLQHFST